MPPASLLLVSILLLLSVAGLVVYFRTREQKLRSDATRQRQELDDTIRALGTARDAATEAQQKAESASRAKSMFLANMSHELRTPLNAIIGYSEMLQDDAADMTPGEIASDLKKITGAGKHLLSLINDVLDFSKIEAGRMDLNLETVDVAALMRDVEGTVAPVVKKQGNQFVVHSEADVGSMTADPGKVRQVLLNLLSNAGKFTTNGTVTLRALRTERHGEDFLALSVEDTGVGLTREQFGRLFQAFAQADATTQRDHGGTGLGLALCRRFTLMMGGDIEVESKAGSGSTFTVMLPAKGPAPDSIESAAGDEVDDSEPISFHTRMYQIPLATGKGPHG
ncbi:sensor histidine kinase [Gemmatimonas sp.]|uniref:sensor histidine kinase n=1 Tax=Gemmatimonas sp. TaxID=1962908 RepID=UPI003562A3EE